VGKLIPGVNDLATLFPEIAAQADGWDPADFTVKSTYKKRWRCALDHYWDAPIGNRTPPVMAGCPYCSGNKAWPGFNDLLSRYPEVAKQAEGWDPSLITPKCNKKLLWKCEQGHKWEAVVSGRTPPGNGGCHYCAGQRLIKGENALLTKYPKVAADAYNWDPSNTFAHSNTAKEWKCNLGHLWTARVSSRTSLRANGCPYCGNKKVYKGFNDIATVHPELSLEAEGWDPTEFLPGSTEKKKWKCAKGHVWNAQINSRTPPQPTGCPYCSGREALAGVNNLLTLYPEIAQEADGWNPRMYASRSGKKMEWICPLGHKWKAPIYSRTSIQGNGCPDCAEFGFKPSLPAWFYLMRRPGEQQLGITNKKEVRLYIHSLNAWQLIEVIGPCPGDQILAIEKKFKKWLRKEVGLIPGTHENWFTAKLEVQSLAELKAKSGIETDLF
jgi:hypothetical protein